MDDLTAEFINETSESLATLEQTLAGHARRPMGRDGWEMAYRLMHTIKGTCGFLRLVRMEAVASASQDILASLRDGSLTPTDGELRALRAALAQIRYMMDYLSKHGHEPEQDAAVPPEEETAPVAEQTPSPLRAALQESVDSFLLPPVPPPAQPVAVSPQLEGPPAQERVSYGTLASLMLARNQIKRESATHPALRTTQKLLDGLVADLKEKLLPRTAPATAYPRPAKVLLVESHGMRFALPQSIIREVARIGTAQRHAQLDEGAMISLRGSWLPRVSLAQRLGQPGSANEAYALVLELQQERLVLCVEQVGELEELMLQPLPKLLRPSMIYEAAAILGDGSPCLILNCTALLSQKLSFPTMKAKQKAMQQPQAEEAPPEVAPAPPPMPQPVAVAPAEPAMPTAPAYVPLLMFGDGTSTPKAIPLTAVGRVEQLAAKDVTRDAEGYAIRCRGELLRPHVLPGSTMPVQGDLHLITLLEAPHIGIVAHRVGSIFDAQIRVPETASTQPVLMRTELNGALTDIINAAAYLPRTTQEAAHG